MWEIDIIDQQVVINVTVETEAAGRAIVAANEAEESAFQANLDRIQTGMDRIATAADRVATAADKTAAATSAQQALDAKNATETKANEILDKIDFTGAVEGDLLESNSAGVYVPKSLKSINQSKVPFEKSIAGSTSNVNRTFAFDSFIRENTTIEQGLGIADSGQTWQSLGTIPRMYIQSNAAGRNAGSFGCEVIERNVFTGLGGIIDGNFGVRIKGMDSAVGTFGSGIIFAKDQNNYIVAGKNGSQFFISKCINSVVTILQSGPAVGAVNLTGFEMESVFIRNIFNSTIRISINSNMSTPFSTEITGHWDIFGSDVQSIRYVGLFNGSPIVQRPIFSFQAYNYF